ncbi:transcriptional regulator, AraC family with amidase-like domain protein [Rubellimicrobium thermophilum DSM 16684]|uniref:Transcriptional regulator, AraC family with amidase-like domain protein n=1 Tax=Rubellimicrobium thermophilum DSM 16684 TaxID=1123069 RepID=S9SC05_9RHOB|nr:transcriptional regulator, AraC family with amidase-like domain protein [Rubellimicrobium thermophilum DSM 16684]
MTEERSGWSGSARACREGLTLGFLLFPGFPMACLTSAIEPLRAANEICGRREFRWILLAETARPVRASAELRFEPDMPLAECRGVDQLYLLSPPTGRFADPRHSPARLRWLDRTGVVLGAFSGGIFPLARAGLMEGRGCSVHWCYEAAFRAEFPDVRASEQVIVKDGRRITASGAGAVFDLMLRLVEERLGRECMTEVACWFQHPCLHGEDARQRVPVARSASTDDALSPVVREAIRLFETHLEDPLRIGDIAAALGLSGRHFERVFKRETGQSPLRYYRLMRLSKARQRVLYTNAPLPEIASSVGYTRAGPMVRHYAEVFGVRPQDERRPGQVWANRDRLGSGQQSGRLLRACRDGL